MINMKIIGEIHILRRLRMVRNSFKGIDLNFCGLELVKEMVLADIALLKEIQ